MERENVLIPQADLDRQREFEEKIRGLFAAREAHPAACVDTFGCQQNVADGQKLMGMLEASGFTLTQDPKEADLVLLNTCAIREHAEDRVFGNLGALTHTKKEIIITLNVVDNTSLFSYSESILKRRVAS